MIRVKISDPLELVVILHAEEPDPETGWLASCEVDDWWLELGGNRLRDLPDWLECAIMNSLTERRCPDVESVRHETIDWLRLTPARRALLAEVD
jgi:hypothetical protein